MARLFQSTRLSRASTGYRGDNRASNVISIHKALASLDGLEGQCLLTIGISIHKALASLDLFLYQLFHNQHNISIHKALASLDCGCAHLYALHINFNPQGSREPRPDGIQDVHEVVAISIHKALASLDSALWLHTVYHKEFQSTRLSRASTCQGRSCVFHQRDFNPQGSREPRLEKLQILLQLTGFQSTRLSRASTLRGHICRYLFLDFNPQGSREPRPVGAGAGFLIYHISIHKALASLDLDRSACLSNDWISIHKALASLDVY